MTLQIIKPPVNVSGFVIGMYVRVAIDYPASQSFNYRIVRIAQLNPAANRARVTFYQPDKPAQDREYPLDALTRCEILPDTSIILIANRERGRVLLAVQDGWQTTLPKQYYVQLYRTMVHQSHQREIPLQIERLQQ